MFIAVLFTIANSEKNPNVYLLTNEKIQCDKSIQWTITERNEILMHTTVWMNLENMLSERGQLQQTSYYMITFT